MAATCGQVRVNPIVWHAYDIQVAGLHDLVLNFLYSGDPIEHENQWPLAKTHTRSPREINQATYLPLRTPSFSRRVKTIFTVIPSERISRFTKNPMAIKLLLVLIAQAAILSAQRCPYQFEGRVPKGSTPATFDTSASNYNTDYIRGAGEHYLAFYRLFYLFTFSKGLSWSQIIQLPTLPTSLVTPLPCPPLHVLYKF